MKNKIKEGDIVEYKYPRGLRYRTFGLVEKTKKDKILVQWLWRENLEGKKIDPKYQPSQNCLSSYNKDKEGGSPRLILISP